MAWSSHNKSLQWSAGRRILWASRYRSGDGLVDDSRNIQTANENDGGHNIVHNEGSKIFQQGQIDPKDHED